ncbi:MAG: lysophospholipid acyltransferase family protein [Deltaproteobacteria bacterium]|nr:lysophospholipid acyltransferase family protein [Deltaproteobacteria bacterium]
MRSFLVYLLLRVLTFVVDILPLEFALRTGRCLGGWAFRVVRNRRRVALDNLRTAFGAEKSPGELEAIARETFRNLGMTLVEFLRMPRLGMDYVRRYVRLEGRQHLDQALADGKGVIALTFHFGNWEMPGLGASLFGYPIVALAQRIHNPWIDRYVRRTREAAGVTILPKRQVSRQVISHLRQGKIVAIFVDQRERTKSQVKVDFFGKKAPTTPSPVVFSLRTGAPMIPIFTIRENNSHHRVTIGRPLVPVTTGDMDKDLETNTAIYTEILENMVRQHPDQYFWLHHRWGGKKRRHRRRTR